jgi:tyrosyl-tRNA synthetase
MDNSAPDPSALSGASQQVPAGDGAARMLEKCAAEGRPARIKFGMDPTAPDLHLGHMVVLQHLRSLQDAGHIVVLIIGDFTARIGDPTGRSKTRPILSEADIQANAKTFCDQAFRVLDEARTELCFNSQWLSELGAAGMLGLLQSATVAQMLERRDFADRMKAQQPLSLVELVYPLLQGFDSVQVRADIEAGGQDQLLNLLAGRDQQALHNQRPQAVVCWPLLAGLDGVKKMSKSLGNHVALVDDAANQFGQIMSISDELMLSWADLLGVPAENGQSLATALASGLHPMQAKRHLARTLVARLHDAAAAAAAEASFDQVFKAHSQPSDMPEIEVADLQLSADGLVFLPHLMVDHMGQPSRGSARGLLAGGGLRVDEQTWRGGLEADGADLEGKVLRIGRRHWLKIKQGHS